MPERVQAKLLGSSAATSRSCSRTCSERAEALAAKATAKLRERGEKEAADMADILEQQRERIEKRAAQFETKQLELEFDADERRQLEADKKHWQRAARRSSRDELEREPERIRAAYEVKATRIEPVGLVYLWPVTG